MNSEGSYGGVCVDVLDIAIQLGNRFDIARENFLTRFERPRAQTYRCEISCIHVAVLHPYRIKLIRRWK